MNSTKTRARIANYRNRTLNLQVRKATERMFGIAQDCILQGLDNNEALLHLLFVACSASIVTRKLLEIGQARCDRSCQSRRRGVAKCGFLH
ncbi:hypothetical protein ANN_25399 [Periplaneta americana]|uniref:Uncharacterized protein n=1 Tax=Periplaneta americana TaxID=6978 RepID=A0ABQ8S1R0_PERAM|nr:hypothetical protein ANN_25399 [Periplaneta americana]